MINIALVFPYENFFDYAQDTFKKHNEFESDYRAEKTQDFGFSEITIKDNIIDYKKIKDIDIIISRGITAELIKMQAKNIPVVEIPVVGNDLIRSLYEAKTNFGDKKIGVIGSRNMIYGVEGLSEIVDLKITKYVRRSNDDAYPLVDQAIQDGCEVIVGGVLTCGYAKGKKLGTVVIKTGKESFWQAISEAKRVAVLNKIEQEKTQMYRTILDYSYEGIIALDQCNHITVCNAEAKKTLDILKKDVIGKKIHNLIDDEKLKNMIINENAFYDEVIPYHDIKIMMKKVPIVVKGEKIGSVINLQDITGIQDMEGKIRKKIYTRGHIAKHTFDDLIAKSDVMKDTIDVLKKFSQVDSDVLIIGDSGTGKEICAQSIHNCSDRRKGPFVAVNCAAIPGNLLESELFGYVGGAFTGASKEGKPGFFELAHNGTIFLDEIAEMPINLQVRLLRVLQEREVIRIGDDKVMPIDVRVIAATNKDLYQYVEENKFREDLYYRLDVLTIYIPSLRERGNDVILIAEHYIKKFGEKYHHNSILMSDAAKAYLKKHHWKGNVRELMNICQQLVVLNKGDFINEVMVENVLSKRRKSKYISEKTRHNNTRNLDLDVINEVLKQTGYNKNETAKILGMSRTTLWRKLKEINKE